MIEAEALKCWCPFASAVPGGTVADERTTNGVADLKKIDRCIGGACMAWRSTGHVSQRTGFCGLAGKP